MAAAVVVAEAAGTTPLHSIRNRATTIQSCWIERRSSLISNGSLLLVLSFWSSSSSCRLVVVRFVIVGNTVGFLFSLAFLLSFSLSFILSFRRGVISFLFLFLSRRVACLLVVYLLDC